MAARDGKIGAMMGGVSRAIGNDVTDIATLERRREAAEKLQRRAPAVPFAQVLAAGARPAEAQLRPRRGEGGRQQAASERGDGGADGEQPQAPESAAEAEGGARPKAEADAGPRPGGFRPRGRAPIVRG